MFNDYNTQPTNLSIPLERVLDALKRKGCKPRRQPSGEFIAHCPCPRHKDRHPSLSVGKGDDGRVLLHCHAGCDFFDIVRALGLEAKGLFPPKPQATKPKLEATYPYTDEDDKLLFEVVRYDPKSFAQRRPDGKGDWIWNLGDVKRVLYRLPEVLQAKARGEAIFVVEGEKDVESLRNLGLCATTNPHGAGKWRDEYSETLRGSHVVIIPDRDEPGRKHAEAVAKSLFGKAESVKIVELDAKDVSDWLASGGTRKELEALMAQAPQWQPPAAMRYEELLATFRKWLVLPSDMPLRFMLCAVIANHLPGDPLWAFIIGPSGDGKTELVNPLEGLDFVKPLDTLTTNTFLSGKQKKDPGASLLLRLPHGAILLMRDFSSVLGMHHEKRDEIFAQLRKVYDGHLTRCTGEGGESAEISWEGKVGLIACVTPAIEGYRAFATTLGERFLYYYLPTSDRVTVAKAARRNRASLHEMRKTLQEATRRFFTGLQIPETITVPDEIGDWIVHVADFVSIARSSVERDWYSASKEITENPDPEVPTRLSQQLDLITCAHAVLMGRDQVGPEDLELTREVALACISSCKRNLIKLLFKAERALTTTEIANSIGLPSPTVRRHLEDLMVLKLVDRHGEGVGEAFEWSLSEFARERWAILNGSATCVSLQNPVPVAKKPSEIQNATTACVGVFKEEGEGLSWEGAFSVSPTEVRSRTSIPSGTQPADDDEYGEVPF